MLRVTLFSAQLIHARTGADIGVVNLPHPIHPEDEILYHNKYYVAVGRRIQIPQIGDPEYVVFLRESPERV